MNEIPTHVVLKRFDGERTMQPNEVVDGRFWKNLRALESRRYVAPLPAGAMVAQDQDGRMWYCRTGVAPEGMKVLGNAPTALDPVLVAQVEAPAPKVKQEPKAETNGKAEDYPLHLGGGRWKLSDGAILRGGTSRVEAEAKQAELTG